MLSGSHWLSRLKWAELQGGNWKPRFGRRGRAAVMGHLRRAQTLGWRVRGALWDMPRKEFSGRLRWEPSEFESALYNLDI